ncbi:type II secretion system minor pseudopilin GspI [Oceanicoccus sp. KOV_DT_Chl]|uniref:type II secretion system minor pseudopilin GspI n=1 Tax=Oceanicoccus sp. KOV_DT_Chl TaxID=1904639 RepID=UPI000C7A6FE0|nr:type II secretion system minor pseudopilin GspI [Oceanicoccus sp. KOV_DT_Chl]
MRRLAGKRQGLGFTLLEVLIALAILAISSLAVIGQSRQSLSQLEQLQLKATAIVLAENQLAVVQIADDWPSLGSSSQSTLLAQRQWRVTTQVSSTSDPWFRKIEVTVTDDSVANQSEAAVLAQLIGYRGRY